MWSFNLLAATRTIEKSMPFVLYRFLFCLGVSVGFLFAALAGAGTAIGVGSLARNANALGPFGAVLGFAGFGYLSYRLRPWWLHAIVAPQLALLAERAKGEPIPEGKAQIEYATQRLSQGLPSASELFQLDRTLQTSLMEVAEADAASTAAQRHPHAARILTRIIGRLAALNHQTILAWYFFSRADNPWRTAVTGVTVQHRHFSRLVSDRLFATLFTGAGFVAAYPLLFVAIDKIVAGLPVSVSFWPYVFAGLFSWGLTAAFFAPIAEAAMMQSFFPLAEEGSDPGQEAQLERYSQAFRALREKVS